jgi:murein L,D-transpeptidase YafK
MTGRHRSRHPVVAVLLFLAATSALLSWRLTTPLSEDRAIEWERSWRRSYAVAGRTLPGTPDLADFDGRLAAHGLAAGAPVLIRIFKREFELELWMRRGEGFHRFATYPICRWSGGLGPKLREGDKQAPEGFYTVDATQLNPNSRWHRSFNLGYPNIFDRAHGRTGSFLMVHGGCGSIGCFAMTDGVVDELWRLVTAALAGGQKRFQVQVYPFRMTDEALAGRQAAPWSPFWADLKKGYDLFEAGWQPPRVGVCDGRYSFAAGASGNDGSEPIAAFCPGRGS